VFEVDLELMNGKFLTFKIHVDTAVSLSVAHKLESTVPRAAGFLGQLKDKRETDLPSQNPR
jgi:hypothetical protein